MNESNRKMMMIIFIAVVLGGVFGALYVWWRDYDDRQRQEELERRLSVQTPPPTPSPSPSPTPSPTPPPTPTPAPTPERMEIRPEYEALIQAYGNEDIAGYLEIPGTSVSYPVVHSADNKDYLNTDAYKNPSSAGAIFLDYENDVSKEDPSTIIYGHNMKADIMFHALRYYRDEAFFREHPAVRFDTLYEDQEWEIFSFHKANISHPYNTVFFKDKEEFGDMLKWMKDSSIYDTGVEVSAEDRVLTLSTCSNIEEDTRYVVHARLIRPGEKAVYIRGGRPSEF